MDRIGLREHKGLLVIATVIFAFYLLGAIFPESFWGFHYPAFLPKNFGIILIVFFIAATIYFQKKNPWKALEKESDSGLVWRLIGAFVAFVFYYKLPIYNDIYGDALAMLTDRELIIEKLDPVFVKKMLSFDFTNLKLGTGTTYGLVGWISYHAEISVYDAFRSVGAVCGAGYVYFMLAIVHRLTKERIKRTLLALLVLGTPLTLAFCGHIEIYAPVYFLLTIFWYLVIRYNEKPTIATAALLFTAAILNFKFHITGALTILVAMLLVILKHRQKQGWTTSWKNLLLTVITPLYLLGVYFYTMVTRSTFGGRSYTEDTIFNVIFLPIKSNEAAPLNRYNLFSPNHLFDYFNLWFLWSAGAVLVVTGLFVFYRKRVQFNHPLVQLTGISMLVYLPVFFVLNPLLSVATDWDLMSIPGILLIIFSVVLVATLKPSEKAARSFESYAITPVLGLSILGICSIFVNAGQDSQSERLISMGTHNFRTYWIGSSTPVLEGIKGIDSDNEKIRKLEKFVRENESYAVKGNDVEFSAITNKLGALYQKDETFPDLDLAREMYEKAYEYQPLFRKNVYDLVVVNFLQKNFEKANSYLPLLVKMKYPNASKSLRMAIHTTIEAEAYEDAVTYCQMLLKVKPDDKFIQDVLHLLKTEEDKSQIKLKFRQG